MGTAAVFESVIRVHWKMPAGHEGAPGALRDAVSPMYPAGAMVATDEKKVNVWAAKRNSVRKSDARHWPFITLFSVTPDSFSPLTYPGAVTLRLPLHWQGHTHSQPAQNAKADSAPRH